jgi:hypothetical protein
VHDVVALDPGVRNFFALYAPTGITGTVGKMSFQDDDWHMALLCKRLDHLVSLTAHSKRNELEGDNAKQ